MFCPNQYRTGSGFQWHWLYFFDGCNLSDRDQRLQWGWRKCFFSHFRDGAQRPQWQTFQLLQSHHETHGFRIVRHTLCNEIQEHVRRPHKLTWSPFRLGLCRLQVPIQVSTTVPPFQLLWFCHFWWRSVAEMCDCKREGHWLRACAGLWWQWLAPAAVASQVQETHRAQGELLTAHRKLLVVVITPMGVVPAYLWRHDVVGIWVIGMKWTVDCKPETWSFPLQNVLGKSPW